MSTQQREPSIISSMEEMDAGLLAKTLSYVLAQAALGTVQHNKKSKVVLTLELERIGDSAQVQVSHKIASTKPTLRGKISEEATTSTPMYTNTKGYLSVSPDTQIDIFKINKENA